MAGSDLRDINFDLLASSAEDIQHLIRNGSLSSQSLVEMILEQIERHNKQGLGLRAIISVAPREQVIKIANELDKERSNGSSRSSGRLFGIPFLIKDTIATDSKLGMPTSGGSWALNESVTAGNADAVQKFLDAGMIAIGKSSLTEFNNYKGDGLMDGWSPVGGQTISAYVPGGIVKGDRPMGHSTATGSSTGSAVGLSAGFSIISLGVESDGSIVSPASRAALYALKPTIKTVSMAGVMPVSLNLDSVGAMARSPADLATATELLQGTEINHYWQHTAALNSSSWSSLRLGFVDENIWELPHFLCEPNEKALKEMRTAYQSAMTLLKDSGAYVQYPVELPTGDKLWPLLGDIMRHDFQLGINEYLAALKSSPVRNLAELVEWNKQNAERELPAQYPSQSSLENSLYSTITSEENEENLKTVRQIAGRDGVDKVFSKFNLDAIASLSDSPLSTVAAAAGYPIATMPLGTLNMNGRPFGLSIITTANQESKLFNIMRAWELTHTRAVPPSLGQWDSKSRLS